MSTVVRKSSCFLKSINIFPINKNRSNLLRLFYCPDPQTRGPAHAIFVDSLIFHSLSKKFCKTQTSRGSVVLILVNSQDSKTNLLNETRGPAPANLT